MNRSSSIFGIGLAPVVVTLLVLNILPEAVLYLSDLGYIGRPGVLRQMAYLFGAFQPELVTAQGELYPFHTLLMFLTYAFLHTDLFHLSINMIGLVWLGNAILEYRQSETFLTLYFLSAIGAAEAFALIGDGGSMVGASGALFGLLGAYLVDSGLLMPRNAINPPMRARILRVFLITAAVIVSDLGSRAILGTPVAWQAHAGGFLTGALVALWVPPRSKPM